MTKRKEVVKCMNPVLIIMVVAVAILLWILMQFAFRSIGSVIIKNIKNIARIMNEEDNRKDVHDNEKG